MYVTAIFVSQVIVMGAAMLDSELSNTSQAKAGDYLISKWNVWYKALDVNKDGKLSFKDAEEQRNKLFDLVHLGVEENKNISDEILKAWDDMIFHGKRRVISEQEFIDTLTQDFESDKQKFVDTLQNFGNLQAKVTDTDQNGLFSKEEFLIAYESFGHTNVDLDMKLFKAYNTGNQPVPVKKFVAAWVGFLSSEDTTIQKVLNDI